MGGRAPVSLEAARLRGSAAVSEALLLGLLGLNVAASEALEDFLLLDAVPCPEGYRPLDTIFSSSSSQGLVR